MTFTTVAHQLLREIELPAGTTQGRCAVVILKLELLLAFVSTKRELFWAAQPSL